jgi:2',3'-cyclic-nucleotide 2'-phosphodiesterase/3'-nucleotidase
LLASLLAATGLAAERVSITLLATTDLHGNIFPYDYYTARPAQRGLAKIATLVASVRRENPNTLLIDCGDTIQGSPLESVYQQWVRTGRLPAGLTWPGQPPRQDPMMLVMNHLRYDAMVLGNHEFNFGLNNLERARSDAGFPWLSANTVSSAGARLKRFAPYTVKTLAGVKVAVIGVTTPAVPSWEKPENYRGLRFLSGKEGVELALAELAVRHKPDLVIVAAHMGLGSAPASRRRQGGDLPGENTAYEIAAGVPGIDAVVFGHSHQELEALRAGDVLLVQPGHWGTSLARLDFVMERTGSRWKTAGKRSRLLPVKKDTPADEEVLRLASPYHEITGRYLDTPVAEAPAEMDGKNGRILDTALVDAIHTVQMYYAKADVSFTPLFHNRVRIPKGPVSVRRIAALYIYDNELYAIEGTGRMIQDALENAARYFRTCPEPACDRGPLINRGVLGFNYDMAQGVEYEIDLTQPAGRRVRNLRYKGHPLRPEEKVRVALNNYRAAGSAGYGMFRTARILWRSNQDIRSLMVEYYTKRGRLPAEADGNWRIVPPAAAATLEREAGAEPDKHR